MTKKIIRNVQRFELPEDRRRKELIEQMRPLLHELAKLQKTDKQRDIDNIIIEASGKLIKSIRECGLEIDIGDIKVEPLWPDVVVLSERKCVANITYEEPGEGHDTMVTGKFTINNQGISIAVKIRCTTKFDEFLSPSASPILLLNDEISNAYNTSVHLSKSEKPTITQVQIDESAGEFEIRRTGGMIEVSFEVKLGFDEDIEGAIKTIRAASKRFAESSLFERGLIAVRYLDTQGYKTRDDDDITEGQFMDRFMSHI